MCSNVFIYLSSNLNLCLPTVYCHGWSFPCCTWQLNFWYTAVETNCTHYKCYICKFQTSTGFKKKTVFICKWICEYSLRISLSYLYLTVFLYCFVFNFYKNIGYNEISVIIKTLKIQNDSCEHVKKKQKLDISHLHCQKKVMNFFLYSPEHLSCPLWNASIRGMPLLSLLPQWHLSTLLLTWGITGLVHNMHNMNLTYDCT